MTAPPLHPDCAPVAHLVGRWQGEGRGLWAADPPFAYREEVVFDHVGKPFLRYVQRTWALDDGRPVHTESGYLRAVGGDGVELVIAQPIGVTEVHVGTVSGGALMLRLTTLGITPTARRVTAVERRVDVDGDVMRYHLRLGVNGEPAADHLAATLTRAVASEAGR